MARLTAIVMAAGHGTRMKSRLPKVLHPACGRPLVYYPVRAALAAGAERIVVVVNSDTRAGIEAALSNALPDVSVSYAVQKVPRGTGDAVRAGLEGLVTEAGERILILSGDTPLVEGSDLEPLVHALSSGDVLSFLAFFPDNPTGYGRVLRDESGKPTAIVEQRDLKTPERLRLGEVNAGMYAADAAHLRRALSGLSADNAQGEYYLTDVVRDLGKSGAVSALRVSEDAARGVNHRGELATAEEVLFARIRQRWAREGVSIVGRPLIDETVVLGADVQIEDGVRLRGKTRIGARTRLDVGTVIDDSIFGEDGWVKPYTVARDSIVGDAVQIGPFAHLRPGSQLDAEVHVGNFVETKSTHMRRGAKANHLAYLGDGDVGEKANVGAGTIFCNYDGFRKSKTIIGARAFIGSDSQLVAPVTIGEDAYVATGTTVTSDVPAGALAVGRVRQENKLGYVERLRNKLRAAVPAKKS